MPVAIFVPIFVFTPLALEADNDNDRWQSSDLFFLRGHWAQHLSFTEIIWDMGSDSGVRKTTGMVL